MPVPIVQMVQDQDIVHQQPLPAPQQAAAPVSQADQPSPEDAADPLIAEETPEDPPLDYDDDSVIVVEAQNGIPGDPIAAINEQTYEAVQKVDQALVEPVAQVYEKGLPEPVRDGMSNFFNNLREPLVFLNFMLQLKPGKAFETLGRFAINTTIGVGGLFDVAKREPFNLPYRNNGFANTLGYYGVKPGAFLYLPLVGPTTVRDAIGNTLDALVLPVAVGKPFNTPYYGVSTYVVRSFDERIELEDKHTMIRESASPYDLMREIYLCERQSAIDELRGREAEDCADTFGLTMPEDDYVPSEDLPEEAITPDSSADAEPAPGTAPQAGTAPAPRPELSNEEVQVLLCPGDDDPYLEDGTLYTSVIAEQCGA